ncbi:MAG: hypothetical protein Q7S51_08930 [Gallionellaceae bacterium]|nr:hypothetical protein [Gallionellaceae bacterium]
MMRQVIRKPYFNLVTFLGALLVLSQLSMGAAWADDAAAIADLKAKLAAVQKDVAQLTQNQGKNFSDYGIPLHGFADVGYTHASNNDTRLDQAGRGFWANSLDFYLTPQFGDRGKGLVELLFEFLADGGLATDLERIQFGYTFNDQLTAWMGRFHAPYGYWNTGFHHGAEIQPSILRPRFIDFEDKGGVLPAHVMGAWATGSLPIGNAKLLYDFYIGNGNAIAEVDTTGGATHTGALAINNSRDSNGNKMVGANIGYKVGDMIIGAHAFTERVNFSDASATPLTGEVSVKMTGLYAAHENDNWENIAEYYHFSNDNATAGTGTNSSWLGFVQVGRTIAELWTPYVRAEKTVLDQDDLYFSNQQYGVSYTRQLVGVRYSLSAKSALKAEVNRTKEGDGTPTTGPGNGSYSEVRMQYAITF